LFGKARLLHPTGKVDANMVRKGISRESALRLALIAVLSAASFALLYWFHFLRRSDAIFTHFFYLPIALAALWWDWKGFPVAVVLSLVLVVSHLLSGLEISLWMELVRCASFLLVGAVVAALSLSRRRLEEDLAAHAYALEERVEERTRQLQEKNRELEAYAHTISHDLTAPLVVIEGYAELLREKGGDFLGEEKEYLQRIETAVERMRRLTRSLLDYARAGAAAGEGSADVGNVLREVVMERFLDLKRKGVELEMAEDLPCIKADPYRLQQVFANLLDNALKYMGENPRPRIEVGWRAEGLAACVFFRDNGMGIEAEDLEEVFQPFHRLSTYGEPGLGIGLSTVRRLVEGWGGRVWVESAPGEGCTFFFTAPLHGSGGCGEGKPR